ncbi:MAG: heavy metal translocating P-type ATPase [Lachnospiraceae bacterium]|nr:heavy metal translocating P-type ATPase [Lachnospiraceae bacterium]
MKCLIKHESKGRMRVHLAIKSMTLKEADILEYYLKNNSDVTAVTVYDMTADVSIYYKGDRRDIIRLLGDFCFEDEEALALVPDNTGRELSRKYKEKLVFTVIRRLLRKLIIPLPVRKVMAYIRAVPYVLEGLKCLARGRIEVPVLDATSITVAFLTGDHKTASSIMFLLRIGGILEEWTHKKSVADLASTMSLNVDKVWLKGDGGEEILVPSSDIKEDDRVVIRMGSMIPFDGIVLKGDAMVNQASMTGESSPVHKSEGHLVYAGTVVEDGECVIKVTKVSGEGRYDRIVSMIEESEKLKSKSEDRASHLADKLVPYSLLGTALTYLITGNVTRTVSILMVDFSCALKLAMPISVLSAMRECSAHNITVKGGKFMEAIAKADTLVFDKTGTLTHCEPKVRLVIPFGKYEEDEALRIAACLEEHYPHSIANAVTKAAEERGLNHEEMHSDVEYIVAHGISSSIDGTKAIIGSYHFAFEDEGIKIPRGEKRKFNSIPNEYSHLYLGIGSKLAAVICIEDPVRKEAGDVVEELHLAGIDKIVMMTGDNDRTARSVAERVGVDEYMSEVLPEDKAEYIKREKEAGRTVIMVGDGVNDSPALSESDAGIAISSGAAIAREIADVTISADDLYSLLTLKDISNKLMKRIDSNYKTIIGFNFMLILLGVFGILQPSAAAILHNSSTILISIRSMRDYLPQISRSLDKD